MAMAYINMSEELCLYLYTLLVMVSVCLSVFNKRQSGEPVGPKFLWDFTCPQGRFKDDQNLKIVIEI